MEIGSNQGNYLFVVAHPDDEVLGGGATIHKLTQQGAQVHVCILCNMAEARSFRPETSELKADLFRSMKTIGVSSVLTGCFHDGMLSTASHLHVVQFIEAAITETKAQHIITHHPNDLHSDHRVTSTSCQEAARISMRQITDSVPPILSLSYMEVPSSTDWALNSTVDSFKPNTFVEIGKAGVDKKIQALSQYRDVMRRFPHPRCAQIIEGLAAYRGGQSGCEYAEAFETVFRRA